MKLCVRWLLIAGVIWFATGTVASAQQFRRVTQPIGEARLDLETGTISRQRAGKAKAA